MALLTASKLSKYFGGEDIFADLSFTLYEEERVALVGINGSGKSTLLDVLAGRQYPDAGSVHKAGDVRLGYLPQVSDFDPGGTLWEAMVAVFADLQAQERKLRALEQAMASSNETERERAIAQYGRRLEAFEGAGGFTYEARIGQVLGGLGFETSEFHQPVAHLSGGQKTRALLARLLLEKPDILLLDEPTNHLDLAGIEWLEDQLKGWQGTMIVVAHDRAFLNTIATRVWELTQGRIETYRGNYDAYHRQREARRAQRQAQYEAQQALIEETEDYVRRYMAGQRSSQAKGRLKRLDHLEEIAPVRDNPQIHVDLQTTMRSGDLVLGLYDLQVGYEPDDPLLDVEEAELRRGECVALVGPNGSGKTSLLRTILKEIKPLAGRVRIGAAVRIGYFAQIQDHLQPGRSVLQTLLDGGMVSIAETRSFLARYGFRGDTVFKDVSVLSGGERARVALALLTLQKANFLLLDEPTNHLDVDSQEILQEVIRDFNGSTLMVSHDRYLIRAVADKVWAIDERTMHRFNQGYAEYQTWHRSERPSVVAERRQEDAARARREAQRRAQRERERRLARQQEELHSLEARIHEYEARMETLTGALEAAGREQDVGKVSKLGAEYQKVESKVDRLLERWAEVADRLPELSEAVEGQGD
jgi:ATP-binding cassette, subfamily F, member 3